MYAVYRPEAGAQWTDPERLPVRGFIGFSVTIDDAGRVLVVHDDWSGGPIRVFAVRRSPAGQWGDRQSITGDVSDRAADHGFFGVAGSANGAAVITHGPTGGDFAATDRFYTTRMNPDGTWQPAVAQPHRLGVNGLVSDAGGRTLLAGWDDGTLWGRWSRADGTWREPVALATGLQDRDTVERWGRWPVISVNRRGDALVTWATDRRSPDTWVRYRAVGSGWSRPRRVPTIDRPQVLRTALGDCGHVAFTWTTPGTPRELHLMRAEPAR